MKPEVINQKELEKAYTVSEQQLVKELARQLYDGVVKIEIDANLRGKSQRDFEKACRKVAKQLFDEVKVKLIDKMMKPLEGVDVMDILNAKTTNEELVVEEPEEPEESTWSKDASNSTEVLTLNEATESHSFYSEDISPKEGGLH